MYRRKRDEARRTLKIICHTSEVNNDYQILVEERENNWRKSVTNQCMCTCEYFKIVEFTIAHVCNKPIQLQVWSYNTFWPIPKQLLFLYEMSSKNIAANCESTATVYYFCIQT